MFAPLARRQEWTKDWSWPTIGPLPLDTVIGRGQTHDLKKGKEGSFGKWMHVNLKRGVLSPGAAKLGQLTWPQQGACLGENGARETEGSSVTICALGWLGASTSPGLLIFTLFLKEIIYLLIFRERGREGEREGEKHQCVVASLAPPTGDSAHSPGTCPDWESNWRSFGSQSGTQSTDPHQPALSWAFQSGEIPF